jgi:peptidoglycan/xylan/chitin deacetylase (PgdA/CDA1 family)
VQRLDGAKKVMPRITLRATHPQGLEVLREYAEFWKIPYNLDLGLEEADLVISSGHLPGIERYDDTPVIITPNGYDESRRIADDLGIRVTQKEADIALPVSRGAHTFIRTSTFQFDGPRIEHLLRSDGAAVLSRIRGSKFYLLSVDLVSDYNHYSLVGLEDPPSLRFRLASSLPFSYRSIPRAIRDRALKSKRGVSEMTLERLGRIECLRTIFLASLVTASPSPIPRIGFWRRGKTYALSLTHDVESKEGLAATERLLEVERELGIRSSWSIIARRYPLSSDALRSLVREGEICAHDTEHDGRLLLQPFHDKVERLKECKSVLEQSTKTTVRGFRAPLLQHSRDLLVAVDRAGYEFDSSVPSWEILSPTSSNPHGIGTVFPFRVANLLEIPVSLPQDHQLLRVSGLDPRSATRIILEFSNWIRELGGLCVILVHPDYDYGKEQYKNEYTQLLDRFKKDHECDLMTLGEVARWWNSREDAYIDGTNGALVIRSRRDEREQTDQQIEVLTGYDERKGFLVEGRN